MNRTQKYLIAVLALATVFALRTQAAIILPPDGDDADGDTVADSVDLCGDTITEPEPIENHYSWMGGDFFSTTNPKTKNLEDSDYSIAETKGCSCAQILADKSGNNNGEEKYGCTKGTMDNFIKNNQL